MPPRDALELEGREGAANLQANSPHREPREGAIQNLDRSPHTWSAAMECWDASLLVVVVDRYTSNSTFPIVCYPGWGIEVDLLEIMLLESLFAVTQDPGSSRGPHRRLEPTR